MTDKSTNERVAEACGFTFYLAVHKHFYVEEWTNNVDVIIPFRPATDPAAALFALEAVCNGNARTWSIEDMTLTHTGDESFNCRIYYNNGTGGVYDGWGREPCTAICNAILAAEENRDA